LNQPNTPLDTVTGLYDPDNDAAPYNPINGPTNTIQPLPTGAATPVREEVAPQVSLSDTGYTAMELQNKSDLLKNIQKIVKQEIITARNQPANHPMAMANSSARSADRSADRSCGSADRSADRSAGSANGSCGSSDAMSQGNEYRHEKHDMSQYIKKNAIPCWGCSLDY